MEEVLEELHPEIGFGFEDNSEEESQPKTREQETQTPVWTYTADIQTSTVQPHRSTTRSIGTQFNYHSKHHKAVNVNTMLEETKSSKL